MERFKYFLNQKGSYIYINDGIMDALDRNDKKIAEFLTAIPGIDLSTDQHALEVKAEDGTYTINPGKAITDGYDLIINAAIYDFTDELTGTSGPYSGLPSDGDKCYVYIKPYEQPDESTAVDLVASDATYYESYNVTFDLEINEEQEGNGILLAELTYNVIEENWLVTKDYRLYSQFEVNLGSLSMIKHFITAHTAGLVSSTDALRPTINTNLYELNFQELQEGDFVYSDYKIYTDLPFYSIDFRGETKNLWYYVYVKGGQLTLESAGSGPSPMPISANEDRFFIICVVYYSAEGNSGTLISLSDLRKNQLTASKAEKVRFTPYINVQSRDVQHALEELDTEKISRDGSISMTGNLSMEFSSITNLQDLNGDDTKVTSDKELFINSTDSFNKGISIAPDGNVYIRGQVVNNIDMASGYTVDGVDVSLLPIERCRFKYIVNNDGPSDQPGSLNYAFTNVQEGEGIYIRPSVTNEYNLEHNFDLPANVVISGPGDLSPILTDYRLTFGPGARIYTLTVYSTYKPSGSINLFSGARIIKLHYINSTSINDVVTLLISSSYLENCTFEHFAIQYDGCMLLFCSHLRFTDQLSVTYMVNNASTAIGCSFFRVYLQSDYSTFIGCSTDFVTGHSDWGWEFQKHGEKAYIYNKLAACQGHQKETHIANGPDQEHAMISAHFGDQGLYDPEVVQYAACYENDGSVWSG